ncbi:MAG: hypothetical protein JEY71_11440 [Sphaerochaeta sp.]|nr:hypothetical protein [Sphaerochaeta sp.]
MKIFKRRPNKKSIAQMVRDRDSSQIVHYLLRLVVILVMINQMFEQNYENVFFCLLAIMLFAVPSFIETHTRIDFPPALENSILFFIFAAQILGEMRSYYVAYPFWDTMLHTANGFLAAAIGFSLVDILNQSQKVTFRLSPFFVAIVAFCFSMTIGVLWEFMEYFMDMVFATDMQKDTIIHSISSVMLDPTNSQKVVTIDAITEVTVNGVDLGLGGYLDIGLHDTIMDMFVNFIGAMVFSIAGYFYVKNRKKSSFIIHFIPTLEREKPVPSKETKEETTRKKTVTMKRASRESRKRQLRQNKPKSTRQ